jgi:hypothetical protein
VGFASVRWRWFSASILGLLSGYLGGWVDAVIMRIADVQLTFPAILIALLIDGIARDAAARQARRLKIYVLVLAIGLSFWVQYARTVRGSTLVEKSKEYVQAAQGDRHPPWLIMLRHVLPNVMGPVLVIATINLAIAIITEATLSFLGVGVPPTNAVARHLIRIGNDFLFSGEWWITIFPGVALVILVLAVNLLGDWLRDALNPKLRWPVRRPQPLLEVAPAVEFRPGAAARWSPSRRLVRDRRGRGAGRRRRIGAGKSLTGAAIIGLLEPPGRIAGGEIRLDGERIDNLPYEEMRACAGARSAWSSRTR